MVNLKFYVLVSERGAKPVKFRDLSAQYQKLKPEIDRAVATVMESGSFIGGEIVSRLGRTLAEYVGVKHCITCANGTDALEVALTAMGVGSGDAVFVPDFTYFATAEAVASVGATPIFVDVYEDTYNMSAESLEDSVKSVIDDGKLEPKAIIPVDLFGLPADYPNIKRIAARHNLLILEDAAQGFGGRIGDQKACSFGDISITSFFPAKPLGCYGDGGALFTNSDEWADLMRSICVHGKGENKYDNVRIGRNSRLDAIQAAMLEVKFNAFTEYELEAVNRVAEYYNKEINGRFQTVVIPKGYYSSFAQYTVKAETKEKRDALANALSEKGIPTMIYYSTPLHRQKAFADLEYNDVELPTSSMLCDIVLSLPMHPYLSEQSAQLICNFINELL